MHFLTQAPFRVDAIAITNDQHAQHHLRVHRRPARVTVIGGKVRAQLAQIDKRINLTEQMILGDVLFRGNS